MLNLHEFPQRETASIAAATCLAARLRSRLQTDASANLVISGGSTPVACFRALAEITLDWERVGIFLSDERWVDPEAAESNERLARENLLSGIAAKARLHGVYAEGVSLEARCAQIDQTIRDLPAGFAASLLGMGSDGHFASLFPDAENLRQGLDLNNPASCIPVSTAASDLPRVSLTLSALARSDEILLLAFGREKRRVFEAAERSPDKYPVSSLLRLEQPPVSIYWAP